MKRNSRKISFLTLVCLILVSPFLSAQNQVEDAIRQMSEDNVSGYLQPFLNAFGATMNSGFSGTAIRDGDVTVRIEFVGMATVIGSAQELYNAKPPSHFPQESVETATIFGDQGAVIQGPQGLSYKFQNGQLNMEYFPLVAPQLTIGNIYNSQLVVRFFTYSSDSDVPDINMLGLGFRHALNPYFENLPFDLTAGLFYQNFSVGEIMKTNMIALNGMVSKQFNMFSVYGGAQFEYAGMNLNYEFEGAAAGENPEVDFTFSSENFVRAFAGFNIDMKFVHFRTDVSLGKVSVLSAAIGFGI